MWAGPFEYDAIVAGSPPVQAFLEPLQLLNSISVQNGIVREAGAVGENLAGNLIREGVEVLVSLRRQEDLAGHAVRVFFLPRFTL